MNHLRLVVVYVLLAGCGCGGDPKSIPHGAASAPALASQPKATAEPQAETPRESPNEPVEVPDEGQMDSIRPDYFKVTLAAGARSISPIRVRDRWPSEHVVGESLVRFRNSTVESLNNMTEERQWRVQSETKSILRWLGQHKGILFFADVDSGDNATEDKTIPINGVRRLRLQDGMWLKPFMNPLGAAERAGRNRVSTILDADDGILVLNHTEMEGGFSTKQLGYRVTRFSVDVAEVVW